MYLREIEIILQSGDGTIKSDNLRHTSIKQIPWYSEYMVIPEGSGSDDMVKYLCLSIEI